MVWSSEAGQRGREEIYHSYGIGNATLPYFAVDALLPVYSRFYWVFSSRITRLRARSASLKRNN